MRLKNLTDEDFLQYKKPCMFLATCFCDWKCCRELNCDICLCQNNVAYHNEIVDYSNDKIVKRYLNNPLTSALVIGGFEPFLQSGELLSFVEKFRQSTQDDIVIYTGYYYDEISEMIEELRKFPNIIVKFGRFKPKQEKHFDEVLGVELANDEQGAIKIS